MNHLGEKCHEIVYSPDTCPFGESVPEINYWVKGDGCCEVEDSEDELCEPKISLEEYKNCINYKSVEECKITSRNDVN